ncbi:MAG: alpha/beta hydrolase [Actinomycetota bacterium]|nr:alpha/beta hydrolase [Actinomycetota bacterium]
MPSFSRAGVDLYFEEHGAGPPVVLHTGSAGDGRMWLEGGYVECLAGYRAILFDHRGRGSSRPTRPEQHAFAEYVADVRALADHLALERYAFVGYSAGAFVGYDVAARDPRVVALAALGGVLAGSDEDEPGYLAAVEAGGMESLNRAIEDDEAMELPGWLRRQFAETDRDQFLLGVHGSADAPDFWELFGSLRCPTLLVLGGDDDPARTGERMAARAAQAELEYVSGCGHVGAFLDVARVGPLVRAFLDRAFRERASAPG